MPHAYTVEVAEEEGGPEAELRERWAVCVARRLADLEAEAGYPQAGGAVDILDAMEGTFVWEMTDAELEANPPSRVDVEIMSVEPAEPPAEPGPVSVRVRVPF